MLNKIKRKQFWRQGSGEIIGFLCVLPVIIFMLAMFVSVVQIGTLEEQLEYVVYNACRQAVVVHDENDDGDYFDDAETLIEDYVKTELGDVKKIDFTKEDTVDLAIVNADGEDASTSSKKSSSSKTSSSKTSSKKDSSGSDENEWVKGAYLRCTVSAYIEAPLEFMSGTKYSTIVMMIERPATEGGDYPWFENM